MERKNLRISENKRLNIEKNKKYAELINYVLNNVKIDNLLENTKKEENLNCDIKYYIEEEDVEKIKKNKYNLSKYVRSVINYYLNEINEYNIEIEELIKLKKMIEHKNIVNISTENKEYKNVVVVDIQKFIDMPLFLEENEVYLKIYSVKKNKSYKILKKEVKNIKKDKKELSNEKKVQMYEYYKNNYFDYIFIEFKDNYFENFRKKYEFIDNNNNVYMNYFRHCTQISLNKYYMEVQEISELKNYIFAYPDHILNIWPKIYEEIIYNEILESFKESDNYIILERENNG